MRLGLDLRSTGADDLSALAQQADALGIWAVLIGAPSGTEVIEASRLAVATEHIHLAVTIDATSEHPLTIAEEVAVLDHLSRRRAIAVLDASGPTVEHVTKLLSGHIVDGVALAPPPAQAAVPVWSVSAVETIQLSGSLDADRAAIDGARDRGTTHLFASFPGPLAVFARHLVTRALTPDFPQIVADHADVIAPNGG